jgi:hypothetical protein
VHHKIKRTTKQLQLKKKQKPAEAKSDFGFTLNKFIDEYNKQIDNGIMTVRKKSLPTFKMMRTFSRLMVGAMFTF